MPETPLNETQSNLDAFAPTSTNPLEALVGEGKKYATVEDLAKGALHAQQHIATLEEEAAANKQELATRAAVEELLKKNVPPAMVTPPADPAQTPATPTVSTPAAEVPAQELSDLIREVMAKDQAANNQASNLERSVSGLDQVTGSREETRKALVAKAQELGVSVDFLKNIAETSPAAFFTTMNVVPSSQPNTNVAPSQGDVNPLTLQSQADSRRTSQVGTKEYYDNLRKTDPKAFKHVQRQMYKDAQTDPEKFFGRKIG